MFASSGDFSGSTAFGNRLNLANGTWYSRAIVAAVKELTEAILVSAEKPRLKPAFLARDARIVPDFVAMHEQKDWQLWAQAPDHNRERQQIDMA